jgi:ATP-dependent DNA helicase RecQ
MDPSERELPLSLRLVNQRLLDAGEDSSPHALRKILGSLSQDGRGFAGQQGSFEIRHVEQDRSLVRIRRGWALIRELSERRHKAAGLVLQRLMAEIPPETDPQADVLVKFTFEQLQAALESDLVLRKESPDLNALVERSLLYLHEQAAIELRQGLAIFRSAMTIRLKPDRNGQKYGVTDFEPLAAHYRERILQVHVMGEYARRGLERMEEAMQLVLAYFRLGREEFVQRYVPLKAAIREHATTATSYERIVTDLENPDQIRIVTAPLRNNLLVLAGPGSGKTRVVVHRTAYLLRVYRVRPRSILVCCYNRMAAIELRRRLVGLVGEDARGVTILTYHSLALRLLGRSIGRNASASEPVDFDQLIVEATALLRGDRVPAGVEADEIRDRLLAGL